MTRNWTNKNSYGCEHVRPRDDWGESVEQWLSSMLAIGRTPETLRTRWYQIARFSRIVDRPIDQVDADAVIAFFLQSSMDLEAKRNARLREGLLPVGGRTPDRRPQSHRRGARHPHAPQGRVLLQFFLSNFCTIFPQYGLPVSSRNCTI